MNDCAEAIECYEKALALLEETPPDRVIYPAKWSVYWQIGNAYYNAGNYREALSAYQATKNLLPHTSPPDIMDADLDNQIAKCKAQLR